MADYFKLVKQLYRHNIEKKLEDAVSAIKNRRSFLKASILGASAALFFEPAFARGEEEKAASSPVVDLFSIRETALNLHLGGVGYYPKSDFVHLDSGRFRFW
jgi:hypothetical protein